MHESLPKSSKAISLEHFLNSSKLEVFWRFWFFYIKNKHAWTILPFLPLFPNSQTHPKESLCFLSLLLLLQIYNHSASPKRKLSIKRWTEKGIICHFSRYFRIKGQMAFSAFKIVSIINLDSHHPVKVAAHVATFTTPEFVDSIKRLASGFKFSNQSTDSFIWHKYNNISVSY